MEFARSIDSIIWLTNAVVLVMAGALSSISMSALNLFFNYFAAIPSEISEVTVSRTLNVCLSNIM